MLTWLIYGSSGLYAVHRADRQHCLRLQSPHAEASGRCVTNRITSWDFICALWLQDMRSRRLRQIQQEDGDGDEPQGDEDAERETWLKQIALASLKAADRLSSIQQVCTRLQHYPYPGFGQYIQAGLSSQ